MGKLIPNYTIEPDVFNENYVLDALRNGWGEKRNYYTLEAEEELCRINQRKYAVLFCNATMAMTAGLKFLKEKMKYQEFFCPSRTWLGTVTPAVSNCMNVGLIDTKNCLGLDSTILEEIHNSYGNSPIVITNVDLMGFASDHATNEEFLKKQMPNAVYIVDAAESIGTEVRGRPAASYGFFSTLSFNATKLVTATIGGALLTDDEVLANYARDYRNNFMNFEVTGKHFYAYEMGTNANYSNLLSAVLLGGLNQLTETLRSRKTLYEEYKKTFEDFEFNVLKPELYCDPNFWQICLPKKNFDSMSLEQLIDVAYEKGVQLRPCFYDIKSQSLFHCEKIIDLHGLEEEFVCLPSGGLPLSKVPDVHRVLSQIKANKN